MYGSERATPGVWPVLYYSDPIQGGRFLSRVLGFDARATMVDEDSVVVYEELYWTDDSGVLVVGSHDLVEVVSRDLEGAVCANHLVSDDIDAVYERVRASEAQVLEALEPSSLGGWPTARAFTLRDPWGNIWVVATHRGSF